MPQPTPPRNEWWADPLSWVEVFALANIAFLALDIYIAHSINAFANPAEWVPVGFSLVAPVLLLVGMLAGGVRPRGRGALGAIVGCGAIVVGVAGMILHLESQFFELRTIKSLVYTAPFAAPLAYAGLGLLLLLDRMVDSRTLDWARWVVLLALGGFLGNFVLTLADHAQNGFFQPTEWIAVGASALAVGSLLAVLLIPGDRTLQKFCAGVMVLQMLVGGLGAALHARASLNAAEPNLWEKVIYGAPLFAPLLFANMAVLALLALWALSKHTARPHPVAVAGDLAAEPTGSV